MQNKKTHPCTTFGGDAFLMNESGLQIEGHIKTDCSLYALVLLDDGVDGFQHGVFKAVF